MKKFEYKTLIKNKSAYFSFLDEINKLGRKGWELIFIQKEEVRYPIYFFKREKHEDDN